MIICTFTFAQKPSLTKAYNFFYEKDYPNAKAMIDLCTQDEKLAQKASTWLYKGNIYFYIANDEFEKRRTDINYQFAYPNAASEAYHAFLTAKKINKNIEGYEMLTPDEGLSKIYLLLFSRGTDLINAKDFKQAEKVLKEAIESYEMFTPPFYPLQGELYYYYAYTLDIQNKIEEAEQYYLKAIHDNLTNHNAHFRLIELYKKENDIQKMKAILDEGQKTFPTESAFYIANIEYHFLIGDSINAQQLLEKIPQEAYNDADQLTNIANLFIQSKNYSRAVELLKKADKITPNNFVIHYNLGVCNYYLAEEVFSKINQLEISQKEAEAKSLRTQYNQLLHDAAYYFEKVLAKEPNDLQVLKSLKTIYARTQSPKIEDINLRIKQIENK